MMKMKITSALVTGLLVTAGAYAAEPVLLSEAQMDLVTAGGVDTVNGFVCPVITTAAVLNSPNAQPIGEGHYSVIGPNVTIPIHATNGNGAGTPPGPHSQPGDSDYTAIWAL